MLLVAVRVVETGCWVLGAGYSSELVRASDSGVITTAASDSAG